MPGKSYDKPQKPMTTLAEFIGVDLNNPSAASLADSLRGEIARVSAKRERWRGYARTIGPARNFKGVIARMTADIVMACAALQDHNQTAMATALRALVQYHDQD
jgi:hypothetical protein